MTPKDGVSCQSQIFLPKRRNVETYINSGSLHRIYLS